MELISSLAFAYLNKRFDGKIDRIERQIHHYGSALNALPLLEYFRTISAGSTSQLLSYILRLGFGGMFAPLSNVHPDGFASTAFHSWADTLSWDPYSGDYGPAFVGLVLGSATYIIQDPDFGLTAYGGIVSTSMSNRSNGAFSIEPRDALRRRLYIQPLGLFLELDAGAISMVQLDVPGNSVTLGILQRSVEEATPANETVLWVDQSFYVNETLTWTVDGQGLMRKRAGWAIPLAVGVTEVTVRAV